jgi:predicted transglutaminase-like protease
MSLYDTLHSSVLIYFLAFICSTMLWGVCLFYTMVYNFTKVVHKWQLAFICSITTSSCILICKHMTFVIDMLNNIFPLRIKMQNWIISSIPMCYAKCHNVNKVSLKRLLTLTNSIIWAIRIRDALRPLGIFVYALRITSNVCETKYPLQGLGCLFWQKLDKILLIVLSIRAPWFGHIFDTLWSARLSFRI